MKTKLNPIDNIREMKKYAKEHDRLGFTMVKIDPCENIRLIKLKWIRRFPGCAKKLFIDNTGVTRMLVLYNELEIRKQIAKHEKEIEALKSRLKTVQENSAYHSKI